MRAGFLDDEVGDRSLARLVVLLGTIEALVLGTVGMSMAVYETINNTERAVGVALVGLSMGVFTSGVLLKGWQKKHETKLKGEA